MSKIDKFLAKPQEVELAGEKFMLKPFTVSDLSLMTKLESKDDVIKVNALKELIFKIMKQIDPETTKEQIEDISISFLEDIMNVISTVNNIDIDEAKKKLIENAK